MHAETGARYQGKQAGDAKTMPLDDFHIPPPARAILQRTASNAFFPSLPYQPPLPIAVRTPRSGLLPFVFFPRNFTLLGDGSGNYRLNAHQWLDAVM